MEFRDTIPEKLNADLRDRLDLNEEILFSVRSDLSTARDIGTSFLIVTAKRVVVLDNDGIAVELTIGDIKEVKIDELFGSGRLIAVTESGERVLLTYTKARVSEFAVMCRVLSNLAEGKEAELPDEHDLAYCTKCGSPLPERGANCPRCVPRIKIIMRLFRMVAPYRLRFIVLMIMTLVAVGSQMGPPIITKMIVDDVIVGGDQTKLPMWIALMVACGLAFYVARLVSGSLTVWLGGRIVADVRSLLHGTLQRLRMKYFGGKESGQIISRVMHDTNELQEFLVEGSSYFWVQSLSVISIAVILLWLDAKLAMFVFLPVPLLVWGSKWFWDKLIPLFHKQGVGDGALHSILGESIRGVKAIKAYSGEHQRISKFDRGNEQMFGVNCRVERTFVGFSESMFWVMSLGVAAVWFFAARRIAAGDPSLSLGDLLAFVGYIWMFYGPLQWFTAILNWMTHAFASAERIFAVLDSPPELYDAPDAIDLPRMKGAVGFRNVRFSYERGKEVIKDVSFDIAAGEMVGLVGKSGAGKSTIINLICRFYDVDSGSITIDGHPVGKLKLEQLRTSIGMVMQEPFLFNASITENICYGVKEATFEEVVRAARAAYAHEFIIQKEDGYDTVVGEHGEKLSGGEKQRLAIARAILYNPPILILDEATSSVDTETEKKIQEAMSRLIEGRTTIGIAHRLSTLRNANRLIVIDDGKIAEIGPHDELAKKQDGIYSKLVNMQTKLSEIKGDVWKE